MGNAQQSQVHSNFETQGPGTGNHPGLGGSGDSVDCFCSLEGSTLVIVLRDLKLFSWEVFSFPLF